MKHLLLSFAFAFGFCVPHAYAQRGALTNTTWQLYFQECAVGARPAPSKWERLMEITFLPGGKIKYSPEGVWKLTGNRLHVNAPELVIVDMNGAVNGAEINGNACLSTTCRENFCVRLVRQPEISSSLSSTGSDWNGFWSAFRIAVKNRNRTALKKMIASDFATSLCNDCSSADAWIRFIDEGNLWGHIQSAVATGTTTAPPGHLNSDRPARVTRKGEYKLSFQLGKDGKWRWAFTEIGD